MKPKYMTVEECRRYKELAAKYKEPAIFIMSLPFTEPYPAEELKHEECTVCRD